MIDDALDLPRDDDGRIVGYQVGKAAALSEWTWRKQKAEDAALFERLYKRQWAARKRAEDPEAARERLRRWRDENRERHRATERRRRRRKAAARRHLACCCHECKRRFTPERFVKGTRFCSTRCRNRWHGRERTKSGKRNRGIRNMRLVSQITRALAAQAGRRRSMAESRAAWVKRVAALVADLARAEAKLERASLARMHLPPGSSRARVTTANANHARAAEHRDRLQERLEALGVTIPYAAPEDIR